MNQNIVKKKTSSKEFVDILKSQGFSFFTGIPDSLLKEFIYHIHKDNELDHVMPSNECESIALCIGYHLSTNRYGVVYLQNSGLGKIVNPIASLCCKEVYSIPMLLVIGWRGCPEFKDEPQHTMMGRITFSLLENLDIPYYIVNGNKLELVGKIKEIKDFLKKHRTPYAVIVKKGSFLDLEKTENSKKNQYGILDRELAVEIILSNIGEDIVVSTTGKISREVYQYRTDRNQNHRDFYVVGGMGCASSIGNAISFGTDDKNIFILDGDGSIIMQLGALSTIGSCSSKNIQHIVLDNNSYDSTGGQSTYSEKIDIEGVAKSCGYVSTKTVYDKKGLKAAIVEMRKLNGPNILVVKIRKGPGKRLIRPTLSPKESKNNFMEFLKREIE